MVSKDKADRDNLKVGSTLKAQLFGPPFTLTVQGIYDDKDLAGNLMVNRHLFDDSNTDRFDFGIFITRAPGVSDADAQKAIEATVTTSGSGKFQTKAEYIDSQTKQIDPFLNIIYGLLTISVFIAAFGIIITLLLAVYERRRELGLVRAVGMTRPQVRSSIRWEAVITAVFGALEGVVIGMLLGWVMVKALRDQGFTVFQVPWTALIIIIVLALVVGVVAAWIPARRAAKANILEAIATDVMAGGTRARRSARSWRQGRRDAGGGRRARRVPLAARAAARRRALEGAAHAPVDLAVAFFTRRAEIARAWPRLTAAVGANGVVWVAWPKRSSGVATDITEDSFRDELLPTGWVDVKVCAIDDTWSGLKFVLRKELR